MTFWKITVTKSRLFNGLKIEKGMSVEVNLATSGNPLIVGSAIDAISQAFSEKYGFEYAKFRALNHQYLLTCAQLS